MVNATPCNVLAVAGRVRMRSGYLHMFDLLRALASRGNQVALACSRLSPEWSSRELGFPVYAWSDAPYNWTRKGGGTLEEFVAHQDPHVIHVHGTGLRWAGRALLNHVEMPIVFTPHSSTRTLWQTRWIQGRSRLVLALSESLREGLLNRVKVPREKLRVIRPGVDVNAYKLSLPKMNGRRPIVGTVAPLEEDRGQGYFLEAAKRLVESGCSAEFVVAGDGPAERELRRKVETLGIGKHLTFVTGLRAYRDVITALDIFVRPALGGGIGHTVIDAMAFGKPIIITAAEGMLEIVDDGHTGLVMPKADPVAMADAIDRLLRDPDEARAMGKAARESVVEQFNMDVLVQKTMDAYQEVLA